MEDIGRGLLALGGILVIVGAVLWFGGRLGLGRLPGDLDFRVGNTRVAFPLVTCILISVILTIILNLIARR